MKKIFAGFKERFGSFWRNRTNDQKNALVALSFIMAAVVSSLSPIPLISFLSPFLAGAAVGTSVGAIIIHFKNKKKRSKLEGKIDKPETVKLTKQEQAELDTKVRKEELQKMMQENKRVHKVDASTAEAMDVLFGAGSKKDVVEEEYERSKIDAEARKVFKN